jgi:hypothetical protein
MKAICKFVYATLLALSALSFAPTPASAQEARGSFTLTHEVRWQNAVVPAGEYTFSVESRGPAELLVLTKVTGKGAGFIVLTPEVEAATFSEHSALVLVKRAGNSYVSSMSLPEYGITLNFTVPAETREMAQAKMGAPASSAR